MPNAFQNVQKNIIQKPRKYANNLIGVMIALTADRIA